VVLFFYAGLAEGQNPTDFRPKTKNSQGSPYGIDGGSGFGDSGGFSGGGGGFGGGASGSW